MPEYHRRFPADPQTLVILRAIAHVASVLVALVGALTLAGWIFDIFALKTLFPTGVSMKANTAICVMLAGIGLFISLRSTPRKIVRLAGVLLGALLALIAAATFSQHITGVDLHIDQLLFHEEPGAAATASPGRMGMPGSSALTLAGISIILLNLPRRRSVHLVQFFALGIILIPLPSLIGYLYSIETFYGLPKTGIAAHTSLALVFLGLGLLTARPDRGIMAVVAARSTGGVMSRRLLLPALVVPVLLGWARAVAVRHNLLEPSSADALFVLATLIIFTLLIWWNAHTLHALSNEAQHARASAEAANRAKDQFLAVLSHELRTPLTPVLMHVQMLEREDALTDAQREQLSTIRRNVELETKLIDDLLDLTRVTRGKLNLELEPCNAHEKLTHVLKNCDAEAAAKKLQIHCDFAATHPVIDADPARLQQVFWNILKNAVKFTPHDGSIRIATINDGEHLLVSITDTGIGILPDAFTRIFDAFEQADTDITRRFGGLGLGLAISKALVDMHGGRLDAASPGRNQGSTFTVRMKGAKPATAKPGLGLDGAKNENSLGGLRVLLVEDNMDTARALSRLLEGFGCRVSLAHSVAAGNAALDAETFDLVISDVGLPDGSGHDLLPKIRTKPGLRAIALSGFGMDQDVTRSLEAGFELHLTKPVNIARLQQALQSTASNVRQPVDSLG